MKQTKSVVLTAFVIAVMTVGSAFAATATSNMSVSANVSADCAISRRFPGVWHLRPDFSQQPRWFRRGEHSQPERRMHGGSTATITLGQGLNPDGESSDTIPLRAMANGADHLTYNLYQDPGLSTVWGNTDETGLAYEGTGSASNVTVYGVVPKGQTVPFGTYNDIVVATITF